MEISQVFYALYLAAANKALDLFRVNGACCPKEITEIMFEKARIASWSHRYPGHIMVPVKTNDGTGYIFLVNNKNNSHIVPMIAWEEDNHPHSLLRILYNELDLDYETSNEATKCLASFMFIKSL